MTFVRVRVYGVLAVIALLCGGSVYLALGHGEAPQKGGSPAVVARVGGSVAKAKAPDLLESCQDTPDTKKCEREQARYEACEASGFDGGRCRSSRAIHRDQQAFVADCRRADPVGVWPDTCDKSAERVGEAYAYCRFLGRPNLPCESSAMYAACVYQGGGHLCADADPVYGACRLRSVDGTMIARHVCAEGNIEYRHCRHAWGVTVSGDVCLPATAVYENCRTRSPIPVCEKAREDDAKANYR
jgi:hypothetical protein